MLAYLHEQATGSNGLGFGDVGGEPAQHIFDSFVFSSL